ncbi:major facilitator superfamily transporter [compost metagenome]
MIKEKIWTKTFIILCLSSFFMFFNIYILMTAFPLYVKDNLNGSQQQMGLAITIYVIGVILIRPFSGRWVDRFGEKKMALIGLLIFFTACLCYFGIKGIILFLVIRLVHGMSYAIASTASSTIASSLIPSTRQGEGMGYYSMFMSIAMVIGPAFGLFLWRDKNSALLLMTVCGIALLAVLLMIGIRLPQSKQGNPTGGLNAEPEQQKKGIHWNDFIEPSALPISLAGFFLAVSYSSLSGFIPSFAAEIHQSQTAGLFFVAFAIMIVLLRPFVGKIFDAYNEHYLYYPGILLFAAGMFLLSQATSGAAVLAAGVIMGSGYGALFSCLQTLAITLSPEHRRGSANGTFFLLFDSGFGLGSYLMGLIISLTSYRMMYLVASAIALLSASLYYGMHHRKRSNCV